MAIEKETDMKKDLALTLSYVLTEASNDELVQIFQAIQSRRQTLARSVKRSLQAGMKVKFTDLGTQYEGVLKSIKIKKAVVEITSPFKATYRVPLNMLEAA
jgi:F0F1-type ATP synthase delta subunit